MALNKAENEPRLVQFYLGLFVRSQELIHECVKLTTSTSNVLSGFFGEPNISSARLADNMVEGAIIGMRQGFYLRSCN